MNNLTFKDDKILPENFFEKTNISEIIFPRNSGTVVAENDSNFSSFQRASAVEGDINLDNYLRQANLSFYYQSSSKRLLEENTFGTGEVLGGKISNSFDVKSYSFKK